ncbi:IclR family transcriptional regulator [Thermus sp.]
MMQKGGLRTLLKGLEILNLLFQTLEGLTTEELARATGLKKRSLYLYLKTLAKAQYVARDPETGRWVAYYPHPGFPLPTESFHDPALFQELAEEAFRRTHLRAYVVVIRPWGLQLVATAGKPGQPTRLDPEDKGAVTPHAHASSAGQAILAHLPPRALWAHLARFPLKPFTPRTLTHLADLEMRLRQIRTQGYARSRGELSPRRCGLALPLLASGQVVGALAIGLPLRSPCALEVPEAPGACRACQDHLPTLRRVREEIWPFSAT